MFTAKHKQYASAQGVPDEADAQRLSSGEADTRAKARGDAGEASLGGVKWRAHTTGPESAVQVDDDTCVWGTVWSIHVDDLPALDRQEGVEKKEYGRLITQVELHEYQGPNVQAAFKDGNAADDAEVYAHLEQLFSFAARTDAAEIDAVIKCLQAHYSSKKENTQGANPPPNVCKVSTLFGAPRVASVLTYQKLDHPTAVPGIPSQLTRSLPSDSYKLVILRGATQSRLPLDYIRRLALTPTNENQAAYTEWKLSYKGHEMATA